MSESRLIRWFRNLLFGSACVSEPPAELQDVLLQLEAEHIVWTDVVLKGGLTGFSYNVHGDLNSLLEHIERLWFDENTEDDAPRVRMRTRAVSKFWGQLQMLLARYLDSARRPPAIRDRDDESILKTILSSPQNDSLSFDFQSAAFWGDVARRAINLRRPLHPEMPASSSRPLEKLEQLYDWTCQSRGVLLDPFTLMMVPHSEHVSPVHWQSDLFLEEFMRDRPNHPLTRSVQGVLQRSMDAFLRGKMPTSLLQPPNPLLTDFLQSVDNVHASIQQLPFPDPLPKVVDVFQRLLALTHQDALWMADAKGGPPSTEVRGSEMLSLLEQLRIKERQNTLLWSLVENRPCKERHPERIYCSLGAMDSTDEWTSDDEEGAGSTEIAG